MSNEPRPSDPPPKRQKVGLSVKEKVAKAPPTPLPVTAVVGGIGDDWFNQDDVTNLLPMGDRTHSKAENPRAEETKKSLKDEIKALAGMINLRKLRLRTERTPAERTGK